MSGRIFKYKIPLAALQQIEVPMRMGAVIRALGMQYGDIMAWAEVPMKRFEAEDEKRIFRVVPTGGSIPDPGVYIGTVFDDQWVWHVYEIEAWSS